MAELIGLIAAILTTACYVPQAWHVVKERNTEGISLLAYSTLFCGVSLWLVYGLMLGSFPLILANALSLPFLAVILFIKVQHRKR